MRNRLGQAQDGFRSIKGKELLTAMFSPLNCWDLVKSDTDKVRHREVATMVLYAMSLQRWLPKVSTEIA
jgi:hypothetical protein